MPARQLVILRGVPSPPLCDELEPAAHRRIADFIDKEKITKGV